MADKKKAAKKTAETPIAPQAEVQPVAEQINENVETVEEKPEEINETVAPIEEKPEEINENVELLPKIGIIGKQPVCVCIPFLASAAQGVELKYALRSLEHNFREDFKVVIIGDRPEWLSDEAIYIAAECVSKNPQVDTTHKLHLAIASEDVSEKFIWSNDDIYFNTPVLLADIEMLSTQGKLLEVPGATEYYKANSNDTIKVLQQLKLKNRNFDMHTPVLYDKNKLIELIELLQNMNAPDGVLIPSIYFNKYYADHSATDHDGKTGNYLLRIVTANTDPKAFAEFIQGKKFLNNAESGWNALLQSYLQKRFPEKSKFEI